MNDPLRDLEILARDNPLYAWKFIAEDWHPGAPAPDWVQTYLRECACRLMDLAEGDLDPEQKAAGVAQALRIPGDPRKTAQALKLVRHGWSAFQEYSHNRRNALVTFLADGGIPRKKLANVFAADKESTLRKMIVSAQKLWAKQI